MATFLPVTFTPDTKDSLVGHISPDLDCITALWHLKRFDAACADRAICLIPAGTPAPEDAFAVVDVGGVLQPLARRFDHHHLPGREGGATSAAQRVFWAWWAANAHDPESGFDITPEQFIQHDLIEIVTDCDGRAFNGQRAQESFRNGLHAVFSAWRAPGQPRRSDEEMVRLGFELLDAYYLTLCAGHWGLEGRHASTIKNLFAARPDYAALAASTAAALDRAGEEYEQAKVWSSHDGRVVALFNASSMATNYGLQTAGATLVVWVSEVKDAEGKVTGWARGVQANTERAHAGDVVRRAILELELLGDEEIVIERFGVRVLASAILAELKLHYLHPAGFMAGITPKGAPELLRRFQFGEESNPVPDLIAMALAIFWALDM